MILFTFGVLFPLVFSLIPFFISGRERWITTSCGGFGQSSFSLLWERSMKVTWGGGFGIFVIGPMLVLGR